MASSHDPREEKLFTDQKILNHTSDFFSRNAVKIVVLFVVVMAAVVVYVVKTHVSISNERDVADYLEKSFYSVMREEGGFSAGGASEGATAVNVKEVLEKIQGAKQRPVVLYQLAQYLFEKGGEANLKEASDVVETLKKDYANELRYSKLAGILADKIAEERAFKMPEPEAAGPKADEEKPAAPATGADAPKADAPAPAPATPAPVTPAPSMPAPTEAPAAPSGAK